jgi:hypothetical protein
MRRHFLTGRFLICAAALPLLVAACSSDPVAVQKFAAASPPASGFHDLMTEYAALPLQRAALDQIVLAGVPSAAPSIGSEAPAQRTALLCARIAALEQIHAAMTGYMAMLGNLATSGTPGVGTGTAAAAAATAVPVATPADPCPPPPTAISGAATQTGPAVGSAAASKPTAASGAAAASPSLKTNFAAFARSYPRLHTSPAQADAAADLATLVANEATQAMRKHALHEAFVAGHDGFLAAIHIEPSVVAWNLTCAAGDSTGLTDYRDNLDGLLTQLSQYAAANDRRTAALSARLQLAILDGTILTPTQVATVCAAAQGYRNALGSLRTAYLTLYNAATQGTGVLTPAMWTRLQPILSDVGTAYGSLQKL